MAEASNNPTAVDWSNLTERVESSSNPLGVIRHHLQGEWKAGRPVVVEEYVRRFPRLTRQEQVRLVLADWQHRLDAGLPTTIDEYRRRFPDLADDLSIEATRPNDPTILYERTAFASNRATGSASASAPASSGGLAGRTEDAFVVATPSGPTPTTEIPGFALAEEIGRGGMGIVYRARDLTLDRDVAVKLLQVQFPTMGATSRRFVEEARITGQLQHPGVPPVYQVGTLANGRPYLAMKLIKGETLATLLSGANSDPGRLLAVFEQVCQTVGFAHAKGVIHRDLKPANIMVGRYGEVQVMDWGLTKVLGLPSEPDTGSSTDHDETRIESRRDVDSATLAGDLLGTPAYMPPEQAGGEVEKVGRRSDVFGLGAVLCAILTGKAPYEGQHFDEVKLKAIRGQIGEAHARLDASRADPELILLAKRCLAVEPQDRPADGDEVARAVAALRSAADARARQAELDLVRAEGIRHAAEAQAIEERKHRQLGSALLASFAVVIGLVGFGVWWRDRVQTEQKLTTQHMEIERERDVARERESARQAATARIADSAIRLAYHLLDKWGVQEADEVLQSAETAAGENAPATVLDRIHAAQRDVEFVARLDGLRTGHSATDNAGPSSFSRFAAKAYPAAFAEFGFELKARNAQSIARMKASPVRKHILAALDTWMFHEPNLISRANIWGYTTGIGDEPWRPKLATEWRTIDTVQALLRDTEPDDRTPSLYAFVGTRIAELGGNATDIFLQGIEQHPTDPWLRMEAGIYYQRLGKHALAAAEFRTLAALRPSFAIGWRMLATALSLSGDPSGARVAAARSLELDDQDWIAHMVLARVTNLKRDPDTARRHFRRAMELAGDQADLMAHDLGLLEYLSGNFAEAVDAYRKAEALTRKANPNNRYANIDYGLALFAIGEWEESERIFRDAVAVNPSPVLNLFHLGLLYRRRGDPEAANACFRQGNAGNDIPIANQDLIYVDHLRSRQGWNPELLTRVWESACRHAPDDPVLLLTLGVMYRWLQRPEDAYRALKRCDELSRQRPDWPYPSTEALSAVANFIGKFDEAIEAGERAIASPVSRQSDSAHYYLAAALWAKGDFNRAEQTYRKAIEICPRPSPIMLADLALAARHRGSPEAESLFQQAFQSPEAVKAEQEDDRYAGLIAQNGPFTLAIYRLKHEAAEKSAPDDPYPPLTLGALYRKSGRHADAAREFAKAGNLARKQQVPWPYPTDAWTAEETRIASPAASNE